MNAAIKTPLLLSLTLLPMAIPLATAADQASNSGPQQEVQSKGNASPLVRKVRRATGRFRDINVAIAEQWVPATPCVSGPNYGAMGVHFVLPARVGDGVLDANEPEALIYEPMSNGAMRLVGVEFIAVEGHLTHFVEEPNRYGLPAFYEIHVWAWEHNPNGNFADWNTLVSCDRQPGD